MTGGRTAVLVPVPLPPALERVRRRHEPVASLGIPAHVTVLFPFVPASELAPRHRAALARIAASVPEVTVTYGRTGVFPGVAYLAPAPRRPFDRLIAACAATFPEHPPYDGAFSETVPHLTLGSGDPATVRAIRRDAASQLPFARLAATLAVYVEGADGRWRVRWRLRLGPVKRLRP
jgi:2'-5' RNA ligase